MKNESIRLVDNFDNSVEAIVNIPKYADSVVIMSHGFTSSKNSRLYVELETELNKINIGTIRYDYFGHGPAYGHNDGYAVNSNTTLSKAVESLRAVINYAKEQRIYNIGLVGSSFGGLVSLVAASTDPEIKALVLKSPVVEPVSFWEGRFGKDGIKQWKRDGTIKVTQDIVDYNLDYEYFEDIRNYNMPQIAKDILCPTLIIHAKDDFCVPISQSYGLAKALKIKVTEFEDGGHSYSRPGEHDRVKLLINKFLVKTLKTKKNI